MNPISPAALERALALRDLSDPACGPHAMQLLLDAILAALGRAEVHRASPIVSVADNYDALGYPPDGAARDARYSRYVSETTLLRTHTSAMIPPLLRALSDATLQRGVLLACPGLVYRRDCIDRLHTGEPHQVDLWRIARHPLGDAELTDMISRVVSAALPGRRWRETATQHPYTRDGRQIDVLVDGEWVEIGECGLAAPELLERCGLLGASGLAMGLGLDRLLMLRKGLPDIRLLRSEDARVAAQLHDLEPWRPVSKMPAVTRDLSLAVNAADDVSPEVLGDRVREALGERAALVEQVEVVAVTAASALPRAAAERLGLGASQRNVVLRVVLRAHERSLTAQECNVLRDDLYAALHRGATWSWAARR